jgi:PilZ domain-containing protein
VELLPDGQPDQRMVQRMPVAEAARVRAVAAENRPRPTSYPAVIVDVSGTGAGLVVPDEAELVPGRVIEIGVEGSWSTARVMWSRPSADHRLTAGVRFSEAHPSFLPALLGWLQRDAARAR